MKVRLEVRSFVLLFPCKLGHFVQWFAGASHLRRGICNIVAIGLTFRDLLYECTRGLTVVLVSTVV